jgi:hypothetical protein
MACPRRIVARLASFVAGAASLLLLVLAASSRALLGQCDTVMPVLRRSRIRDGDVDIGMSGRDRTSARHAQRL